MMERVVVTGLGLLCPLGSGVANVWSRILQGASGIVKLQDSALAELPARIAGLVPEYSEEVSPGCWRPKEIGERAFSRASVFAMAASEEALADSALDLSSDSIGVAVGTGISDLEEIVRAGNLIAAGKPGRVSPYFVPRILTNMAAGHLSIKYRLRGPNHSVSTACTTGAHSIGDAYNFIRLGMASAMLCGGTEGCVNAISLTGFSRCRALATSFNDAPTAASRPFDAAREGFVMGEGAGILVLESLSSAHSRQAKIYAEVVGYGLSGDGFHLTSPDKEGSGARLCMRRALGDIPASEVGYVNAHATSTPAGDEVEARAIADILPSAIVSSSKGALGHLLGAAGAAEAVLTILTLHSQTVPPNLNLETPLESDARLAPSESSPIQTRYALSNSFGFGGTNASLLFASYRE